MERGPMKGKEKKEVALVPGLSLPSSAAQVRPTLRPAAGWAGALVSLLGLNRGLGAATLKARQLHASSSPSSPPSAHRNPPKDSHEVAERHGDQVGLLLRWLWRLLRLLWLRRLWLRWRLWLRLRLWLLGLWRLLGLLPGSDVA